MRGGIRKSARVYLVGGVSAVLFGWRSSTVDIDLKIEPELDEILRRLPEIKEELQLNRIGRTRSVHSGITWMARKKCVH